MSTWRERKQARIGRSTGKLVVCTACSGSGHYDHNGSPKCVVCAGTGKVKVKA